MIVRFNKISPEFLKNRANHLIDKNFQELEEFYPTSASFFHEFALLFIEINTCLMHECHFASVTLTNYTLEKLLKYALVYNEIGITKKSFAESQEKYKIAHDKYQRLDMGQTINGCCSKGLITKAQKKYLQDEILKQIRNGFSHSDPNMIIDPKNGKKHYMGKDIKNPENPLKDLKLDPFLQSQIIANLVVQIAFPYYKKVVELSIHIQEKLNEKETLNKMASL